MLEKPAEFHAALEAEAMEHEMLILLVEDICRCIIADHQEL